MRRITTPALLTALLLAACTGGPGSDEVVVLEGDPRLLVHGFTSGMEARMVGELEYRPGGRCLVLASRDGATGEVVQRAEIVWPAGVEPLEDGRAGVTVPGFGEIAAGDPLDAAGGHAPAGAWMEEYGVPGPCVPGEEGFAMLNADSFTR
ncbi:hypothetical protein SUDANB121_01156 [Nocardiopsis dassonvillei]|uniref:hypothetical protein n=1 Tax=Nocardiopsis dassonvillei TaxID=2014 RepID=UPI003F571D1C